MQKRTHSPRYQAIADDLLGRIANGEYAPGNRLPSEAQLCADYGVSRGTAVRAVEQLVSDGIVSRRQGAGSFVARPSLHRRSGNLLSFSESAASEGLKTRHALISIADASIEQAMQYSCDEPAVFLVRLRYLDDVPCAVHRSIIPAAVANHVDALNGKHGGALNKADFSLYRAFELAGFRVCTANERVTTRLATLEETNLLNVSEPAPVMVVFRRSQDKSGRLVEAVEAVYHGQYYSYDMHLVAAPTDKAGTQLQMKSALRSK